MEACSLQRSHAKKLEGKVAIVTGGANGIGRATAKIFAGYGAKVIVADINDVLGRSLAEEALASNQTIWFIHCDVSKDKDVKNLVDTVVSEHGKLDIMFSNAGIMGNIATSILSTEIENLEKIFSVNVFGAFFCAKHAARVMIPSKTGSIIFTASRVSVIADVTAPHAYASTKHAVAGLTKNLCVELGGHGIRVNCISPGMVPTDMPREILGLDYDAMARLGAKTNVLKGVTLQTNDVGEAAAFLASDESRFITGVNLLVDGGNSTTNPSLGKAFANSIAHSS